ncbi:DUF72 domain-containing protein [Geobacter sp. DSM 9736]|uniref:DUF72 domain-containing protein n=1 Tax=Geobacter sp. DSM 9736 TaxID=1277350 RepID=UPI000B50DE8E|nr:DUF72 domain-containing protein [Geobacter sp. DSM 9736]SNB45779.1 Uncharacterized conserved protein YecE, DUF72 family [Geobacter sp. DSM 9736]
MASIEIGCSGFNYKHWRGNFYPEKLPQRRWFEHYCTVFSTVELNVTFYRLPSPETFSKWRNDTPSGFAFAIKGSRFITHIKRLADAEEAVHRYFDAARNLGDKLKVVLWQLSPGFQLDLDRFASFLELIAPYPVRHTFEFRHPSWLIPSVTDICRRYGVNICAADNPPFLVDPPQTADFVYIRRHGHDMHYTGNYSAKELEVDAGRIRGYLEKGRDVYIYFNNDIGGYAPRNAVELRGMMEG